MRQRMVKPEFFDSGSLSDVPIEARYAFIGLWVIADDNGNLKYHVRHLNRAIFPLDDIDDEVFYGWLVMLEKVGCIFGYEVNGTRYITIPNFLTYQTINRPSKTTIPAPDKAVNKLLISKWKTNDSLSVHGVINESSMSTHANKVSKEGIVPPITIPSSLQGDADAEDSASPSTEEIFAEVDRLYPDSVPCPDNLNPYKVVSA